MPQIPDRWLNYSPIGKRICGTRLIAFKVPLRTSVCKTVLDDSTRLDVRKLLATVPRLGLVIDLTNTTRYYDPEDFRARGVEHIKIMCPGHKVPTSRLRRKFRNVVKDFLESNIDNGIQDKLIGVHCTHGVNRTGYLICDYMVSDLCITPQEAIERFQDSRGHSIERTNYIKALSLKESIETNQQLTYPDHQPTYPDYQSTYSDHPRIYSRKRSPPKSLTSSSTPTTVANWRSPDYVFQRNLQRKRRSDTCFGSLSGNINWRNGLIKRSSDCGSDRSNASEKTSSRYQSNRRPFPEYMKRNTTSNPSKPVGNLKNTHVRFDVP